MHRFKNVLVVLNPDGASDALLARAARLAEVNNASLTLVDVVEAPGNLSTMLSALPGGRATEVESEVLNFRNDRLEQYAETLRGSGSEVQTQLLQGVEFIEIIRYVLKHGNDLVLKAAEKTPAWAFLRGPDLHLLRKCPCPVWILNSASEPNSRKIMAAVDPDPSDPVRDALNHRVMQLATSLASRDGAKVDVINAWNLYEEATLRSTRLKTPEHEIASLLQQTEQESEKRLQQLVQNYGSFSESMRVLHMKGPAEDIISEHAESEQVDTLVMGTVGRTGIAGLFIGNTAETVLNRVGCSVLTVKPEGFVSPVTLDEDAIS